MRQRIDAVGQLGLITDLDPVEAPPNAWTRADNVRFRRGEAAPFTGYRTAFTATGVAHYLVGADLGGTWHMWYPTDVNGTGGAEEIYEWDGSTEVSRTRVTTNYTAATSQWNGCVINGVPILNNYGVAPQYLTASATQFANLVWDLTTSASSTVRALTWEAYDGSSKTYRAKTIRPHKNFLFAFGIKDNGVEYPYLVHWSNPADPGTVPSSWDYADATHESGRTDLADTPGWVVDGLTLRDSMVIYKEDAIWLANYTGGQFQFQFSKLSDTHGLLSQDCAVDIGGRHICVGDGIVYLHDGHTITNLVEGRAADELYTSIDPTYYYLTFATHNTSAREVWICYPSVGSTACDRAFVYSYEYNSWTRRELPSIRYASRQLLTGSRPSWPTDASGGTWERDYTESWDGRGYNPTADSLIGAGAALYEFDYGTTFGGTAPTVTLERTDLRLGEGGGMWFCRAIYPRATGQPLTIQVGAQLKLGGSVSWSTAQTYTPGSDAKIDCRVTGEALAIRFRSTDGAQWTLSGYELDVESAGQR